MSQGSETAFSGDFSAIIHTRLRKCRLDFQSKKIMQSEEKNDLEGMSDISRDGWNLEEIAEESVNKPSDEIKREVLRGNETEENADGRDIAGSADKNKTPQGHEEAKKDEKRGEGKNA